MHDFTLERTIKRSGKNVLSVNIPVELVKLYGIQGGDVVEFKSPTMRKDGMVLILWIKKRVEAL